jgi:hypothetical protein
MTGQSLTSLVIVIWESVDDKTVFLELGSNVPCDNVPRWVPRRGYIKLEFRS